MGLLKLPHLSHSLYASLRAPRTSTTTLLPSLAVQGGVFDAPQAKCLPPERGRSSSQVTAAKASTAISSSSPISFSSPGKSTANGQLKTNSFPLTPPLDGSKINRSDFLEQQRSVVNIPISRKAAAQTLATPPLTPEDSVNKVVDSPANTDALEFLLKLFPHDGVKAAQYARRVAIFAGSSLSFSGVVLALPGEESSLYVLIDAKSTVGINLRERSAL